MVECPVASHILAISDQDLLLDWHLQGIKSPDWSTRGTRQPLVIVHASLMLAVKLQKWTVGSSQEFLPTQNTLVEIHLAEPPIQVA